MDTGVCSTGHPAEVAGSQGTPRCSHGSEASPPALADDSPSRRASLRGVYKRNEYRKVILSLTVLRHFDCVLADTNQAITPTLERMEP